MRIPDLYDVVRITAGHHKGKLGLITSTIGGKFLVRAEPTMGSTDNVLATLASCNHLPALTLGINEVEVDPVLTARFNRFDQDERDANKRRRKEAKNAAA